jgi:hypothetical protein
MSIRLFHFFNYNYLSLHYLGLGAQRPRVLVRQPVYNFILHYYC